MRSSSILDLVSFVALKKISTISRLVEASESCLILSEEKWISRNVRRLFWAKFKLVKLVRRVK